MREAAAGGRSDLAAASTRRSGHGNADRRKRSRGVLPTSGAWRRTTATRPPDQAAQPEPPTTGKPEVTPLTKYPAPTGGTRDAPLAWFQRVVRWFMSVLSLALGQRCC